MSFLKEVIEVSFYSVELLGNWEQAIYFEGSKLFWTGEQFKEKKYFLKIFFSKDLSVSLEL